MGQSASTPRGADQVPLLRGAPSEATTATQGGFISVSSIVENPDDPTKQSRITLKRNFKNILSAADEKLIIDILKEDDAEMAQLD